MKMARGRGSNNRHGLHLRYWRRMSKNTHVDNSIALTSDARAQALSVLKGERRLRRLHKFAVETHRERIAAAHEDAVLEAVYLGLCAENVRKHKGH